MQTNMVRHIHGINGGCSAIRSVYLPDDQTYEYNKEVVGYDGLRKFKGRYCQNGGVRVETVIYLDNH